MDENNVSDQVTEKLIEMGFEKSDAIKAVNAVGPSVDDAVEYVLNGSHRNGGTASTGSQCSSGNGNSLGKRAMSSSDFPDKMRQSTIWDHFQSKDKPKRHRGNGTPDAVVSKSQVLANHVEEQKGPFPSISNQLETVPEPLQVCCSEELDVGSNWEPKVNSLLRKHFGYSSLRSFQEEALAAWLSHEDCLVLAATGSGKSLCFQIPALLTGKVVVVVSPLISLMHDQCLNLSKHGVSACFLGSGQPDGSVEQKAMRGMYSIIYVCPETILRLIEPLQKLAESRGITLFAIDEVHCISKWGHDFRPDYRRLSTLRENFSARNLKFLKFNIPIMALTATATVRVRQDILDSLCMPKETKIVLTSFFRPNLRFSVKHSRTRESSYEKDFCQLIDVYARKKKIGEKKQTLISQELHGEPESDQSFASDLNDSEDSDIEKSDGEISNKENGSISSREKQLSVEYLENEVDVFQSVEDWDVAYGEFSGQPCIEEQSSQGSFDTIDRPNRQEERLRLLQEPLEEGPTIIYVPTRKETLKIANYLCKFGVKAAAYNAGLPKSHLRQVHKEFHENSLQVVVATIAFGMGIDKLNVRRILHYGWPQSLEAYYQEAGRAGRDGKLADCLLYANLSRVPTLLPSKRSEDQKREAYKMLSDCFRYGMNTSCCRARSLVEYFGEDFHNEKCLLCDICVDGPPKMQDVNEEATIVMQIIAARYVSSFRDGSYDDPVCGETEKKFLEKPNLRTFVNKIREQSQEFITIDLLWWKGLARIMEARGYIKEGDEKINVQIKFPEPTKRGLEFIQSGSDEPFHVYPEADMILSMKQPRAYPPWGSGKSFDVHPEADTSLSTKQPRAGFTWASDKRLLVYPEADKFLSMKQQRAYSTWGKGWADPEIRRQRLSNMRSNRKPREPRIRKRDFTDLSTTRGRILSKLSEQKR